MRVMHGESWDHFDESCVSRSRRELSFDFDCLVLLVRIGGGRRAAATAACAILRQVSCIVARVTRLLRLHARPKNPSCSLYSTRPFSQLAHARARCSSMSAPATLCDDRSAAAADAFVRSWRTGHFLSPQSEAAFREWHALRSTSILCTMQLTLGSLFIIGAALAISSQDSLKGQAFTAFPSARPVLTTTSFISRTIPILSGILLLIPSTRRAWGTGKWYNMVTFTCVVLPVVVETIPTLVEGRRLLADDTATIIARHLLRTQATPSSNYSLAAACSQVVGDDPTNLATNAYWSSTSIDCIFFMYGGLSGCVISPDLPRSPHICPRRRARTHRPSLA